MNSTINTIASIFTGKGGTIKLAVFGSLIAAVIYEIMDFSYALNVTTKEGTISFTPVSDVSGQQMQTDSVHENEPEQDQMPTTVTDVQAEDKPEE